MTFATWTNWNAFQRAVHEQILGNILMFASRQIRFVF